METENWPAGPPDRGRSGYLRELQTDRLTFLRECARYGDFVPFRAGKKQLVFLNHPDYIETVISKRAADYSKNYLTDFFHPILRQQLLLSETNSWLEQRRLAQPALRPDRLPAYGEIMVDKAEAMCARWRDGDRLDIAGRMRRLTLEILAATVFDLDVAAEAAEAADIVDTLLDDVARRAVGRSYVPFVLPTPANLRLRGALKRLDYLLDELIDERRKDADGRADLLSRLVASPDAGGHGLPNDEARLTAMPLFFAGHETTAMTLTWTLLLLARHPEVERKVVEELESVLGTKRASAADLRTLRYLGAVVSESIRLYPPIWGFGRQAMRDTEIGPYRVPAGTTVFMSQWVIHRDPRYFDQPDEFAPERWMDGLDRRLPRCAYLPFGAGPRRCLGNNFAIVEAVLVLATICRAFRLEAADASDPVLEPLITLRPKEGPIMVARAKRE